MDTPLYLCRERQSRRIDGTETGFAEIPALGKVALFPRQLAGAINGDVALSDTWWKMKPNLNIMLALAIKPIHTFKARFRQFKFTAMLLAVKPASNAMACPDLAGVLPVNDNCVVRQCAAFVAANWAGNICRATRIADDLLAAFPQFKGICVCMGMPRLIGGAYFSALGKKDIIARFLAQEARI